MPVDLANWTFHDLRTTFNYLTCAVLEIDAHVADRILEHVAIATTFKVMQYTIDPSVSSRAKRRWRPGWNYSIARPSSRKRDSS